MAAIKQGVDSAANWLEVHEVGKISNEAAAAAYAQIKGYVEDGPFSFRIASFIAGLAMSLFGVIGIFVEGGFGNTLINFYQLGFGLITIALESHKHEWTADWRKFLVRVAKICTANA